MSRLGRLLGAGRFRRADDVTGLPDRRALVQRLTAAVARREPIALLLLDLDEFRRLNDTLGHDVGDQVLALVGRRLEGALRSRDLIARVGGDEFAIVLSGEGVRAAASVAAERLLASLDAPFVLDGLPIQLDASIGIAHHPGSAASAAEVFQQADVAMYQAKAARTGLETYAAGRDDHSRHRLVLSGELRRGIPRGELVVYLQPQVRVRDGALVAAEALVRWVHPERGLLAPGHFLPGVQHSSVMRPLTEFVLATSLSLASEWRRRGVPLPVAVNVAAPNLLDGAFPETVARLLAQTGADPRDLRVEITEHAVMSDTARTLPMLDGLRALQVGVALDDFGTGHSSLERLIALPVDELKIDRCFVMGMTAQPGHAAIVRAAVTLGRDLGLTVVAEGVESLPCWRALGELGCDVAQGFLFGHPMTLESFEVWRAAQALPTPDGDLRAA